MKLASQKLCYALVGAAVLLFAGCSKKPKRPEPSSTLMGPQGGGALTPSEVPTTADQNSGLQQRDAGAFDANGQLRGALEAVYFDFDRYSIKAAERPKLQAAKDYLDKNPQYRLLLEGHCDWRGTAEYNLGLGDHRANEVKKYLTTLGVAPDRLETLSKGSEEAKKNADEADMAKDRRVELVVLKEAAATP